ncbi:MAG: hypothetical protein CMJ27_05105 [Phycisphaerae bacterium]|nr:hypothetical protein [Phycisphaerae bacterium]
MPDLLSVPLRQAIRATRLRRLGLGSVLLATPGALAQDSPPIPDPGSTPSRQVAPTPAPESSDRFRVRIAPTAAAEARRTMEANRDARPRLLILLCENKGRLSGRDPLDAPFLERPQPILSMPISAAMLEDPATFLLGPDEAGTVMVPDRLDHLRGGFLARAVLDLGLNRGHAAAGNPVSAITPVDFAPDRDRTFDLVVDRMLPDVELPTASNLKWIELDSPSLTRTLGRPIRHRAGVAFPPAYFDLDAKRRFWPVIYVIPGFGGDHRSATRYAAMLRDPAMRSYLPQAVWIVLDPEDRLGHHGFADGDNFGPRATALVEEFIPWLEKRFRLVPNSKGRFVTGHSSGGWSSLWLQLQHPGIFGGCFSSAPDPVDFAAFGTVDLGTDANLFEDADSNPRACYRAPLTADRDHVMMTIAEEMEMEHALAPDFTSGEQWAAWNAMFSGRDAASGLPVAAFDLETGLIDRGVIERDWSRYDIAALLAADPKRLAPIFRDKVRLLCGDRDSFYLDLAVERLAEAVAMERSRLESTEGPGYIELVPGATHGTIVPIAMQRWYPELRRLVAEAPER